MFTEKEEGDCAQFTAPRTMMLADPVSGGDDANAAGAPRHISQSVSAVAAVAAAELEQANARRASQMQEAMRRPFLEGFLTKEGGNVKNWKKRFFRLDGPFLSYYDPKHLDVPKGVIVVTACELAHAVDQSKKIPWRFTLTPQGSPRVYLLAAADEEKMNEWVREIRRASMWIG